MKKVTSLRELRMLMKDFGVDTSTWGRDKAKTLTHLFCEVRDGECALAVTDDGRLVREVSVLCLDIEYKGMVLREDFQLFYEGKRRRERELDASTGEKFKPGETPEQALSRLVNEEFPILSLQPKEDFKFTGDKFRESDSVSYPGLHTRYRLCFFAVELTVELPAITVQEPDKLVAYKWVASPTRST